MADYTANDLEAVRQVLAGNVSLAEAARTYSPRQSALLAVTILTAANAQFTYKGEYGQLLEEIARLPGVPQEGFDRYKPKPDWYVLKSFTRLVAISKRLGLFSTRDRAGNDLRLVPQPRLQALLGEHPDYREFACSVYEQASHTINQARQQHQEHMRLKRVRLDRIMRAIERDPVLRRANLTHFDAYDLHDVHRRLGELLGEIYPSEETQP
jgi:hypothetical protein